MGQKINPQSLRLGVTKPWPARWFFAGLGGVSSGLGTYKIFLQEDEVIRNIVKAKVAQAGIASLEIERTSNNLRVLIKAARPGFIIGRGGKGIEELSKALEAGLKKVRTTKRSVALSVNVEELKRSETASAYVGQQIAWDLEKRLPFRMTILKALENLMQNKDVKGAKIHISGRLDGGEIARREWKSSGALPLQTLRADIDYGQATAFTTYGTIGIKVWIYRGEIFSKDKNTK